MLNVSRQKLTGTQAALTTIIQTAALNSTSVTEAQWNNFNLFAAWRNPYYLVYRDYQYTQASNLLTSLLSYYDFEGNSNDQVSSLNGTDNAVTYSISYGKIGQGVSNNSTASSIYFGTNSTYNFIHQTGIFAVNVWVKLNTSSGNFRFFCTSASSAQRGFHSLTSFAGYTQSIIYNPSIASTQAVYSVVTSLFNDLNWHMYTITGDGSYFYIYLDAVLRLKVPYLTFSAGNSQFPFYIFNLGGGGGSQNFFIDELGIWSRNLNLAEIAKLYNSGAGLTYPF